MPEPRTAPTRNRAVEFCGPALVREHAKIALARSTKPRSGDEGPKGPCELDYRSGNGVSSHNGKGTRVNQVNLAGEVMHGLTGRPDPEIEVKMPNGIVYASGPAGGMLRDNVVAQSAPLSEGETGAHKYRPTSCQGLQNELPWHTMAAYMLIAGRTNSEVAMAAGVAEQHISVLRSNLWFQQRLAQIANNDGEEILASFKSHALAAVERIARIAESGESERNRLSANTYLVDQAVGKAVQKNLTISGNVLSGLSPQEEYSRTQEELRLLREARNPRPAVAVNA